MHSELVQTNDIFRVIDLNTGLADSTKTKYKRAIEKYLKTGQRLTDVNALEEYAANLSKSGRSFLKAAIRLWSENIATKAKAGATPDNVNAVQATVYRIEALNDTIKVESSKGDKAHNWLSLQEVRQLLATCDTTNLPGQRDKLALSLLLSAGLRRNEAVNLQWSDIVVNDGRTVLNITGKGDKARAIPVSKALSDMLNSWSNVTGKDGYVLRSLGMSKELGESLSAVSLFHIVRKAGKQIDKPELAPHDLRRTYAQLGYKAGVDIGQISKLLGHSSIKTTQKYLGLETNYEQTISDFIPLD